jgi:hypothetical protein
MTLAATAKGAALKAKRRADFLGLIGCMFHSGISRLRTTVLIDIQAKLSRPPMSNISSFSNRMLFTKAKCFRYQLKLGSATGPVALRNVPLRTSGASGATPTAACGLSSPPSAVPATEDGGARAPHFTRELEKAIPVRQKETRETMYRNFIASCSPFASVKTFCFAALHGARSLASAVKKFGLDRFCPPGCVIVSPPIERITKGNSC